MARLCVVVLCAVLGLSACAPVHKDITPELQSTVAKGLKDGSLTLNDSRLGSDQYYTAQEDTISAAYRGKQWQHLAELVYQVGHAKDIAYYYLGAAAENLGYPDAALKYYERAAVVYGDRVRSHHCREISGECAGIDLARVLPARIQALRAKAAPAPAYAAAPPAQAKSTPVAAQAKPVAAKHGQQQKGQGLSKAASPETETLVGIMDDPVTYRSDLKELTTSAMMNASYQLRKFGDFMEGTINDDAPYSPVKFNAGEGEAQAASIHRTAVGVIGGQPCGVVVFGSSDGTNHALIHLCLLVSDGDGFKAIQGVFGYYCKAVFIKNDQVHVQIKYRDWNDASCCPSLSGTVVLEIAGEALVVKSAPKRRG